MTRSLRIACVLVAGVAQAISSQTAAVKRAAGTITEADVRRRIFLIADDSMGGRDTPSPGLDQTASYIASQFARFGLKPGGDSGSFLLKYPIAINRLLAERSKLRLGIGSTSISTSLAEAAALITGPTRAEATGSVVLVGGLVVPDSLTSDPIRDRIVVYVPAASTAQAAAAGFRTLQRFGRLGARAVVVVIRSDSLFQTYQRNQLAARTTVGDGGRGIPILAVRERVIIAQVPEAAEQFLQLRAAPGAVVRAAGGWSGEVALQDTVLSTQYVPNVVGILEGRDPVLRSEYVVFSAHMDHVGTAGRPGAGCRAAGGDSICNGADDDASGTVGVVELAEAFSRPGARPKRSLIFLTVSGEEHGLWGSNWFVSHPPVPLPQIVADLNADMIGRNWKDTIVAIGKEHSDLGSTLSRVNAAHPELHMHAIDDRWPDERFYQRSDHFNFAQRGVPILFFFNGVHTDYHRPSDSPDKIDYEKESRIVRLLFYLGQEVANAPQRPRWVPESYKEIVQP